VTLRGFAVAALALALALPAAAQVPEPEGYRSEPYRAPVPETLTGAVVVDADAAHALWWSGRVAFVDVLPHTAKPADLPEGTLWRDKPRDSIPGAIWLPNTGYDALAPETLAYLLDGIAAVTDGDPAAPVLFYCQRECWMSWNAARRAVEHGHTRVYWFPDGTDGWAEAGLPLERVEPHAP
jgi:PQQ-dependent catabolism-associated CXXCW motif protein